MLVQHHVTSSRQFDAAGSFSFKVVSFSRLHTKRDIFDSHLQIFTATS